MPTEAKMTSVLLARALLIAALASMALQTAGGQGDSKATASAKTMAARPGNAASAAAPDTPDVAKTLKAAAEAVGLARWSGVGGERRPEVDVINTMEIWGSGTTYCAPLSSKFGEPWPAYRTEYHATLGYNP